MEDKEYIRQALEKELIQVTTRLQMLDLIEERLLQMKQLAQSVINEDLTDDEIEKINKKISELKGQINLLEGETDGYKH